MAILPPADDVNPLKRARQKHINNIISSWILNSISKEIASSTIFIGSAFAISNNLNAQFQQNNGPRIYQLRKDLINLSQGTLSVTQYFTKLKCIWEELNQF